MTTDKVEETERTLQNLSFWNVLDTDEQCELRTTFTQYHQDLMSEVVEKIEYEKSIHSQLAGEWTGIKLDGTRTTINPHLEQYEAFTKAQTIIKSLSK